MKAIIKKQRNPNMELLRIIAMMLVVMWHFFYHGVINGQVSSSETQMTNWSGPNLVLSQFIIAVCSICVNVYVLLTGFFMIGKGFKSKRLLKVWCQTFFYGLSISLLFYLFADDGLRNLIRYSIIHAAFPYLGGVYWFVHDYLALLIIAPLLGIAALNMSKQLYDKIMMVIIILGVSIPSVEPYGDDLGFYYGHSFIWFVCLFMAGAYLRRFDLPLKKYQNFKMFFLISFLISIITVGFVYIKYRYGNGQFINVCYVYNGFSYLTALLFFSLFKQLKLKNPFYIRAILKISPLTFGVYLIHDNPFVREWLWPKFNLYFFFNSPYFILCIFFIPLSIFLLCIMIDYFRSLLFRIIRIDDGVNKLSKIIDGKIHLFLP